MQQSRPGGRACSLLLSPCRVCLFLSASQPPLPPPHSAWGVIKSVYACPQSKEIGIHTPSAHTHTHTRAHTHTHTHTHTHHKQRHSHLNRHSLAHSETVQDPKIRTHIFTYIPQTSISTQNPSNICSVLNMVCHKITVSKPVTFRASMAANLLLLQPCVCVCVCVQSHN